MERKIKKTEHGVVIAQSVYDSTHKDFKGIWETERDDIPHWKEIRGLYMGKRTWMPPIDIFGHTCLCVEGVSLEIITDIEFDKRFH